jgi:hypothetical protein
MATKKNTDKMTRLVKIGGQKAFANFAKCHREKFHNLASSSNG